LGVIGKAGLFLVLMEGFQETKSLFFFWVGAVTLLNAAIALYYYLQIPYQAYFKQASKAEMPEVKPVNPWIIGEGIAYILVGVLIFGFIILVFI
jgi:NADH:ubiquinone oxidoreductase subunit 2 (subunit N)